MWFKVDDRFHSSRKVLAIPRRIRLQALGLWVMAGSWTAGEELDGMVPDYMVDEWGGTPELIDALVKAGLWEVVDDGARFVKWSEWQPTREQLDEKREHERTRKAEWRARKAEKNGPAGTDAGRARDAYGTDVLVPSNPTRPDPTRPILSTSDEVESAAGPLSPFCSKHPRGTEAKCRACGTARMAFETAKAAEKAKPTPIPRREATCHVHPEWPLPCDKCAAIASEAVA